MPEFFQIKIFSCLQWSQNMKIDKEENKNKGNRTVEVAIDCWHEKIDASEKSNPQ